MIAFVTYGALTKIPAILLAGFFVFMAVFLVTIDIKYQRSKVALEERAIEIGRKIGIKTQYEKVRDQRKLPYWLQVLLLFVLFFTGMIIWFMILTQIS